MIDQANLPTRTYTFLFTDLEGSTRLLKQLGIDPEGKTLQQLLSPLPPGQKLGEGVPLFPKVEAKQGA